jgi:TRAP-type C4-dicarboxylate transport system permease small subunit
MGVQAAHLVEGIRASAIALGVAEIFLIGAVLVGFAFIASFFLREIPLRRTRHDVPAARMAATTEPIETALPQAPA